MSAQAFCFVGSFTKMTKNSEKTTPKFIISVVVFLFLWEYNTNRFEICVLKEGLLRASITEFVGGAVCGSDAVPFG